MSEEEPGRPLCLDADGRRARLACEEASEAMSKAEAPKRIAVLRPGALGDAIVTLPVLESLVGANASARVVAIGSPAFRLAGECGLAAEWLSFDDPRLLGLFAEGGSSEALADCDLCITYGTGADPLLKENLLRSGAATVIEWRSSPDRATHIVDHLLGAVEAAGSPVGTRVPRLVPQADWTTAATAFLAANGVDRDFVAIHPGSGGRAKKWPARRFAELARRVKHQLVWLLGPAEAEDEELRELGEGVGVVADGLSLATLAGLLAACRVYVGNDSGVSHLAAAVGAPTVTIFGPTDPAIWAPRGERVAVLGGPEAGGLEGVSVDQVAAAIGRATSLSPSR